MVAALELHPTSLKKSVTQKRQVAVVRRTDELHKSPTKAHSKVNNSNGIPYSIIHSTPGRLRLRVPRLICDSHYVCCLQVLLEADPDITRVAIEPAAMSVGIDYQRDRVNEEQMRLHLVNLIQLAATAIIPVSTHNSEPDSEKSWSQLRLPVLATLLAVLAGPVGWSIPSAAVFGTLAASSIPVAKKALESIWQDKRLNIDCLDLMALTLTT
ncbi:MAG: heavy metal translocating P-type ATPase, partial [Spirulina sp.]